MKWTKTGQTKATSFTLTWRCTQKVRSVHVIEKKTLTVMAHTGHLALSYAAIAGDGSSPSRPRLSATVSITMTAVTRRRPAWKMACAR